jgi:hypothetical protein
MGEACFRLLLFYGWAYFCTLKMEAIYPSEHHTFSELHGIRTQKTVFPICIGMNKRNS